MRRTECGTPLVARHAKAEARGPIDSGSTTLTAIARLPYEGAAHLTALLVDDPCRVPADDRAHMRGLAGYEPATLAMILGSVGADAIGDAAHWLGTAFADVNDDPNLDLAPLVALWRALLRLELPADLLPRLRLAGSQRSARPRHLVGADFSNRCSR